MPFRFVIDLYDIVNINPRNFDELWIQRAAFYNLFYLNNDDTATIMNSLCQRCCIKRRHFLGQHNIAPFISIGTADETYIHIHSRIEKLIMSFNTDNLNEIFFRYIIKTTTLYTRISKSIQTDMGNRSQAVCCYITEILR